MRLPTVPEHIKFHWREQDFCKNVLLALALWAGYAPIGGRVSRSEAEDGYVTKQTRFGFTRDSQPVFVTFSTFSET